MTNIMTLREWQQVVVPENQYIVQASTTDGSDGITAASIGMCYGFVNFEGNYGIGTKEQLCLCAFNVGTDHRRRGSLSINRRTISQTLLNNGFQNEAIENSKYFTNLPKYKFVISPEGNGIDCHRHYEALMAKSIPIVEDNPMIRVKYGNVPILYTRDYSEITQEYLEQKYAEMLDQRWDFSNLFMASWSPEEQLLIQFRGNFWCEKMAGKPWYQEQKQMQMNTHPFLDGAQKPHVYVLGMAKISL